MRKSATDEVGCFSGAAARDDVLAGLPAVEPERLSALVLAALEVPDLACVPALAGAGLADLALAIVAAAAFALAGCAGFPLAAVVPLALGDGAALPLGCGSAFAFAGAVVLVVGPAIAAFLVPRGIFISRKRIQRLSRM